MCINLTEDTKSIKPSVETLKSALFGALKSYEIKGHKDNNPGNASGQLVGGNLSLLTATLGSETSLSTMGKIIFIEEIRTVFGWDKFGLWCCTTTLESFL